MLIVCPNCATSYDVAVASLRPSGRRVRCVRCQSVWQAELSHADKLIAAAEALAPVRRAVEAMAEAAAEAPAWESPPAELPAGEPDIAAFAEDDQPADQPAFNAAFKGPPEVGETADSVPELNDAVEVESPPISPVNLDAGHPPIDAEVEHDASAAVEPPEDIESVAARRFPRVVRRQGSYWPLSRLQSAILALVILDAIVIGWRADFVRFFPQTASFYASIGLPVNLRGLDFDGLATATEQHEGVPILVLSGNVINQTGKTADVPHLRFAVRNAARQEIYSWTAVPTRTMLPSGEAVGFRTRLASPPPDAHDVLVRFVNRYDMLTGTR